MANTKNHNNFMNLFLKVLFYCRYAESRRSFFTFIINLKFKRTK